MVDIDKIEPGDTVVLVDAHSNCYDVRLGEMFTVDDPPVVKVGGASTGWMNIVSETGSKHIGHVFHYDRVLHGCMPDAEDA